MDNKKKSEELQTRREFFKKAAKTALPILGAVVLSQLPLNVSASESEVNGCDYGCSGSCWSSCQSSCRRYCDSGCTGSCSGGCKAVCANGCKGYSGGW